MSEHAQKRPITVLGQNFESLESAARKYGMSRNTVDYRLSKGWTPEEALGLAARPSHAASTPGKLVAVDGRQFKTIKEAAKYYGRSYNHVIERLSVGCGIERALGLIKRQDSLQSEFPEIANQWNFAKNGTLTPTDVTPYSGRKVWWKCENGHEWQAIINGRSRRGRGCPYCAGQRPTDARNFATEFPQLMKEWDWEKNSGINPREISPRGKEKVWWKCSNGHSWQALILNRTRKHTKNECAVCQNRVLTEANSLAVARPDIAESWHPVRNAPLTPSHVIAGGSKKVWWQCSHGHEWRATVGSRVNAGTGCPHCSNQTSRIEIAVFTELDALFTNVQWRHKIGGYECDIYLADEGIGIEVDGVYWHRRKPEKEAAKLISLESYNVTLYRLREKGLTLLSPRDVSYKSSEDELSVISRLLKSLLTFGQLSAGAASKLREYLATNRLVNEAKYRQLVAMLPAPPPGYSLADLHPDLAKQWAFALNAPLSPEHFRPQANKKVWWRCEAGHTWRTTPNIRVFQGTGCPACPRKLIPAPNDRNLAVLYPDLAAEWHPYKNAGQSPKSTWPKSNRKIWWRCEKEHEWQATVTSRVAGHGCPYCSGRFATPENNLEHRYPHLLDELDPIRNMNFDPSRVTPHSNRRVWWVCKKGHSWSATICNRSRNKSGCPHCAHCAARKHSIESIQARAASYGGKCLSETFTSSRRKLKFECKAGHIWESRAGAFLYSGKWCSKCSVKRQRSNQISLDLFPGA